jgi:hexosaminidase
MDRAPPGTEAARPAGTSSWRRSSTYLDHTNALPLPPDEQAILDAAAGAGLAPAFVTTTEEAYGFEPIPPVLTPDQATHILGGQAQLWTEWMLDLRDVERDGFPRLAAFSEAVWSPTEVRDYVPPVRRLVNHVERLRALDARYFGSPGPCLSLSYTPAPVA